VLHGMLPLLRFLVQEFHKSMGKTGMELEVTEDVWKMELDGEVYIAYNDAQKQKLKQEGQISRLGGSLVSLAEIGENA
jgi:hypothetical protein